MFGLIFRVQQQQQQQQKSNVLLKIFEIVFFFLPLKLFFIALKHIIFFGLSHFRGYNKNFFWKIV